MPLLYDLHFVSDTSPIRQVSGESARMRPHPNLLTSFVVMKAGFHPSVLSHKYLYIVCHSCESRNPETYLWIPVYTGMTKEKSVKKCSRQDTIELRLPASPLAEMPHKQV